MEVHFLLFLLAYKESEISDLQQAQNLIWVLHVLQKCLAIRNIAL